MTRPFDRGMVDPADAVRAASAPLRGEALSDRLDRVAMILRTASDTLGRLRTSLAEAGEGCGWSRDVEHVEALVGAVIELLDDEAAVTANPADLAERGGRLLGIAAEVLRAADLRGPTCRAPTTASGAWANGTSPPRPEPCSRSWTMSWRGSARRRGLARTTRLQPRPRRRARRLGATGRWGACRTRAARSEVS